MAESKKVTPKKAAVKRNTPPVSRAKKASKSTVKKTVVIKKSSTKKVVQPKEKAKRPASARTRTAKKTASTKSTMKETPTRTRTTNQAIPSPYHTTTAPQPKKLFVRARHIYTKRALVSLFQFDADEVAIQVARYGGVVTIFVGAIFTLYFASFGFGQMSDGNTAAVTDGLSSTTETISPSNTALPPLTKEMVSFDVAAPSPLKDKVPVMVQISSERPVSSVLVSVQNIETKQTFKIGYADHKTNRTFEARFDTTSVPNGRYQFVAKISDHDFSLLVNSGDAFAVQNAPVDSTDVDKQEQQATDIPTASDSDPADSLEPDATTDDNDHVSTDTATSTRLTTATTTPEVNDQPKSSPITDETAVLEEDEVLEDVSALANKLTIESLSTNKSVKKLSIKGEAMHVEFYFMRSGATTPSFIGRAYSMESREWQFIWDTSKVPNGTYEIFAKVITTTSTVSSNKVRLQIETPVTSAPVTTLLPLKEELKAPVLVADTEDESMTSSVEEKSLAQSRTTSSTTDTLTDAAIANSDIAKKLTIPPPPSREMAPSTLITDYKRELQPEMDRLAAALRNGDNPAVVTILARLEAQENKLIARMATEGQYDIAEISATVKRSTAQEVLQAERSERIIRDRMGSSVTLDTDKDGITDYDERELFNTDPNNPDSDNDGFTDGAEILSGFNPLDARAEAVVIMESPKEFGITRNDILAVDELITVPAELAVSSSPAALITGRALPNSFVTLFIYSNPVVVTLQTDANGNWSYQFDKELEDGTHEVYVGITDNAGRMIAKSEPFRFVKTAEAFTPEDAAAASVTPPLATTDLYSTQSMLLVASISIVAIGLLLLLLGHFLHYSRREEHLVAQS